MSEEQIRLESSRDRLIDQKSQLSNQKRSYDNELAKLKNQVRIRRVMPPNEYAVLCKKQDSLRSDIQGVEAALSGINSEIRSLTTQIELKKLERVNIPNIEALMDEIIAIRDYYTDFAKDATRVSSSRIMAADVSSKIDLVLKRLRINSAEMR